MPTLKRFGGVRVALYPGDHPPPHVHVLVGGEDVAVDIRTARPMFAAPRGIEEALAWVSANSDMLLSLWTAFSERRGT